MTINEEIEENEYKSETTSFEELKKGSISLADINKLVEAGFNTVETCFRPPRNSY